MRTCSSSIIALLVATSSFTCSYAIIRKSSGTEEKKGESGVISLTGWEQQRVGIFERVSPSVVNIDNYQEVEGILKFLVKPNESEVQTGSGSGFFWDKEGHVVTNYHVVAEADTLKVTYLAKDKTWKTVVANVIGKDRSTDVAVLKLKYVPKDIHPAVKGSSADLRVGQNVMAIGSPFGLDHTLTTGVVSAKGREMKSTNNYPISDCIQIDASINPGNSGGPLYDSFGDVVGMNAMMLSTSGGSIGIGFAIPIDTIKTIVDLLIKDGYVTRPYMGITYIAANQLGSTDTGLYVIDVEKDGPAEKAGMIGTKATFKNKVIGDLIVAINDKKVETESDVFNILKNYKPGDTIDITVMRSSTGTEMLKKAEPKKVTVKLTLGSKKSTRRRFRFTRRH